MPAPYRVLGSQDPKKTSAKFEQGKYDLYHCTTRHDPMQQDCKLRNSSFKKNPRPLKGKN